MRIGQLAQLNEVAYGSDFLYTTSGLYGFFCLKSILINNLFNSFLIDSNIFISKSFIFLSIDNLNGSIMFFISASPHIKYFFL